MPVKRPLLQISLILLNSLLILFLFFQQWQSISFSNFSTKNGGVKVRLEKISSGNFILIADTYMAGKKTQTTQWKLNYPVFRLNRSDVDGDGYDDIIVGVIKPTRFDTVPRKRIFIFKLVEGFIRPLWLGSRVSQPLEDFGLVKTGGASVIRTIEIEKDGSYMVADYKWQGFGLSFIHYLNRGISLKNALLLLKK